MRLKKLITIGVLITLLLPMYTTPFVYAGDKAKNDSKLSEKAEKILAGKKIGFDKNLLNRDDVVEGRYVAFVKKGQKQDIERDLDEVGVLQTFEDDNVYENIEAIPLTIPEGVDEIDVISNLENEQDIVAIEPVYRRELSATNAPDDPYYPANGCSGDLYSYNCQWNLNAPSGGNYGIDLLDAWDAMDGTEDETVDYSDPTNYGGSSSVVIAVMDTGIAFEDFDDDGDGLKYDEFSLMTAPSGWDFDKAPDITDSFWSNTDETDFDGVDDDPITTEKYCMDDNGNGECNVGETSGLYIDDKYGLNFLQFKRLWMNSSYNISGSYCTNESYTDYKCVQNRVCNAPGYSNTVYYGCQDGDMGHPNDTYGHGTMVGSIIAAKTNNTTGMVGIAPGITLMPLQVFDFEYTAQGWDYNRDSGASDLVARAINYAIDNSVDIVNMSFGGPSDSVYEEIAMNNAYVNEDILLVAASGNGLWGVTRVEYPAGYDSVMAIGASAKDGDRSSYSTYGQDIDVVAPVASGIIGHSYNCYFSGADSDGHRCMGNDDIADIDPSDPQYPPDIFTSGEFTYGNKSGTSFAAPQVTAVAGLLRSKYPAYSAQKIRALINITTYDLRHHLDNEVGHGILNAYGAVSSTTEHNADLSSGWNRMFETIRTRKSGYVTTRYSDDLGITWSDWDMGITALDPVTTVYEPNSGNTVQAIRGNNDAVKTRYSSDKGVSWSAWSSSGASLHEVSMVVAGTRVIQAVRGTDGRIYVRYSDDGGENWSSWTSRGKSRGKIALLYESVSGNVIMTVAGTASGIVYSRISTDNGSTWGDWDISDGHSSGKIAMVYEPTTGRVVQIMKGKYSTKLYARSSGSGGADWTSWKWRGATINENFEIESSNGNVVITSVKYPDTLKTAYSSNGGITWNWNTSKDVFGDISLEASSNYISQTVTDHSNHYVYTRLSSNGGASWSSWKSADQLSSGDIATLYDTTADRVIQLSSGYSFSSGDQDAQAMERSSDSEGQYWASSQEESSFRIQDPDIILLPL